MDLPVKAHIAAIQKDIEALSDQLMKTDDQLAANELDAQIRSLRLALAHYELALKIEAEVLASKARTAAIPFKINKK